MSIKSDRWIRRMAAEHGMIEPFEPGQVRENEAGTRCISYGTSSYGYDVRCARDFKIFTNINSAIVDPKHFDESSLLTGLPSWVSWDQANESKCLSRSGIVTKPEPLSSSALRSFSRNS